MSQTLRCPPPATKFSSFFSNTFQHFHYLLVYNEDSFGVLTVILLWTSSARAAKGFARVRCTDTVSSLFSHTVQTHQEFPCSALKHLHFIVTGYGKKIKPAEPRISRFKVTKSKALSFTELQSLSLAKNLYRKQYCTDNLILHLKTPFVGIPNVEYLKWAYGWIANEFKHPSVHFYNFTKICR